MIAKLDVIVFDAADYKGLAAFYAQLAGWTERHCDDDWVTLGTPDGWKVAFQQASDHAPPTWPTQERPQQAHLELRVPDLEEHTRRAETLGATVLARNETWHTLADPAGHPFDLCLRPESPGVTLMGLMLDCPDAGRLAAFYAELLGKPVTYEADGMVMIGEDGAQPVMFQQVEGYAAPRWPDPAHPQQLHLDLLVEDLDGGEAAALALGATRLPGEGKTFRVFADPVGKPFCLCLEPG